VPLKSDRQEEASGPRIDIAAFRLCIHHRSGIEALRVRAIDGNMTSTAGRESSTAM
jgi:hypothetical protein